MNNWTEECTHLVMVSVKVTIKVGWMPCYYVKISCVILNWLIYPLYTVKLFTLKLLVVDAYMPANPMPTI